jgi:DNA anti-recombination protein RmuC
MISFRVSEDEYAGLKNLCANLGARSVSDMARDAVHRLVTNHRPNNQLETVVQVLQGRIEALDTEVKRLGMALNGQTSTRGIAASNGNGDI